MSMSRNLHGDLIMRTQIAISRPLATVWPKFLDFGRWMSGLHFKTIAGVPGEQGEVRLVTSGSDSLYRRYYIKAVCVVPGRQYVLKVLPEEGDDYFGFADFSFSEEGGVTQILYTIYLHLQPAGLTPDAEQSFCKEQYGAVLAEVEANNYSLRKLVEEVPLGACER